MEKLILKPGKILCVPRKLIQVGGKACETHSFAKEGEDILYSVAFRKMSAKTQVFGSDAEEHLRTRLTHTLEVARISVNMAEELGFDGKLAEAIALGHDIGHTPFGHVGERALHRFSTGEDRKYTTKEGKHVSVPDELKGFKHNLQSVRLLAAYTPGCRFSNFVLYGIRGHSSLTYKKLGSAGKTTFYDRYAVDCGIVLEKTDRELIPAWSVEAFLVKWADEIAQRHHDLEDAYFQKIMSPKQIMQQLEDLKDLAKTEDLKNLYMKLDEISKKENESKNKEQGCFPRYLGKFVIEVYTSCCVEEFRNALGKMIEEYHIATAEDFANKYQEILEEDIEKRLSLERTAIEQADQRLNKNLRFAILDSYEVQRLDGRSEYLVRRMLRAFKSNPQQLPDIYINRLMKTEIYKFFSDEDVRRLFKVIKERLQYDIDQKSVEQWADYESRNALRVLLEEVEIEPIISPALMRVVFDYVAAMRDRSAYEEYRELYE